MVKSEKYRRNYFIEKKFQSGFILKFCVLVIIGSLLTGALVYFFSQQATTVVFEHGRVQVKSTADFLLPFLIQTIIVVCVVVSIATVALTLFISHKIAGPLYRLKKELAAIGLGDLSGAFALRGDDQLQDVARSMSAMIKGLRDSLGSVKNDWRSFKDGWEVFLGRDLAPDLRHGQDMGRLNNIILQIDKELDHFKIRQ